MAKEYGLRPSALLKSDLNDLELDIAIYNIGVSELNKAQDEAIKKAEHDAQHKHGRR